MSVDLKGEKKIIRVEEQFEDNEDKILEKSISEISDPFTPRGTEYRNKKQNSRENLVRLESGQKQKTLENFGVKIKKANFENIKRSSKSSKILIRKTKKSQYLKEKRICKKLLKFPKSNSEAKYKRKENYIKRRKLLSQKVKRVKSSFENEMEKLMEKSEKEPQNLLLNLLIGKFGMNKFIDMSVKGKIQEKKKIKNENFQKINESEISVQSLRKLGLDDIGILMRPDRKAGNSEWKKPNIENFEETIKKIPKNERLLKTGSVNQYQSLYSEKKFQKPKGHFREYSTSNYFYRPYIDEKNTDSFYKLGKMNEIKLKNFLKKNSLRKKIRKIRRGFNSKLRDKLDTMLDVNPLSYSHDKGEQRIRSTDVEFHSFYEENSKNLAGFQRNCRPRTRMVLREKSKKKNNREELKKRYFGRRKKRFSFKSGEFQVSPTVVRLTTN